MINTIKKLWAETPTNLMVSIAVLSILAMLGVMFLISGVALAWQSLA